VLVGLAPVALHGERLARRAREGRRRALRVRLLLQRVDLRDGTLIARPGLIELLHGDELLLGEPLVALEAQPSDLEIGLGRRALRLDGGQRGLGLTDLIARLLL